MRPYYAAESVSKKVYNGSKPPSSCHLILFFMIELSQPALDIDVTLCAQETDGAAWLGLDDLEHIFNPYTYSEDNTKVAQGFLVSESKRAPTEFNLEILRPQYPNKLLEGIGKAHHYSLRRYLKAQRESPKL